jgi:type I restriction enzyme M protein
LDLGVRSSNAETDESLADSANLPDPDVIAEEIVEDLRAALAQFEELWAGLGAQGVNPEAQPPRG